MLKRMGGWGGKLSLEIKKRVGVIQGGGKGGGTVVQCSTTPSSVSATPPCSATRFQRQLDVRHPWQLKGDRCNRAL